MYNLAFDMAVLPMRVVWRLTRWAWRRWRGTDRRWSPQRKPWTSMAGPAAVAHPDFVPVGQRFARAAVPAASSPAPAAPPASAPGVAAEGAGEAGIANGPATPGASSKAAGGGNTEDPGFSREGDAGTLHELARFHTREGDGFRLIFHFQLKQQRVRRTVWLDFTRLAKRMGREQAWAMRARLGHAQMRYAVDQPQRPWGRLELPQAWLAVDSTRGQKARKFMLDTLDAVNALIDEGGIALVSGRHQTLPPGDRGPGSAALPTGRTSGRVPARSAAPAVSGQAELPLSDGAAVSDAQVGAGASAGIPPMPAILPDPADDQAGLPRGVEAQHVCTGILAAAGVTERTDASGRNYRIFYADVDVEGRLSRQTGVDLERALLDAHAAVGMRVRLQHLGYVPVNGGRHKRKVWHATVLPG